MVDHVLRSELNEEQFCAATDSSSHVLTLACAGSGKSRTLAYRIAWLIAEKGADPSSIVAFTFTEKAADSIKNRVADALQKCGLEPNLLGRMFIGTIHSFCQTLISDADARFRQFEVLDSNRLKLFLVENYAKLNLTALRPRARGSAYFETISSAADAWSLHNEELLKISEIEHSDPELGEFLKLLRDLLLQRQFIDFSFMQRLAVEILSEKEDPALTSKYKHILVDEYQDINPIQDELIRCLAAFSDTLMVVGDDDQSIYGWRGADVSRIQTFEHRYSEVSSHTIGTNYRSSSAIVEVADYFAHQEIGAERIVKKPKSAFGEKYPNEFRSLYFDTRVQEADWVVAKIAELLGSEYVESDGRHRGLCPSDFAILMRSTRQPEPNGHPPRHVAYTSRLDAQGIPYQLEAGGSLFDRPQVEVLRQAFELLRDGSPDRNEVKNHFDAFVSPSFPDASFNQLTQVFSEWGRNIHSPSTGGVARRRVYPQNLVFDLLEAYGVAESSFDDATFQDIGLFSRIIQDVETVYPSVDGANRFKGILNFLSVVAGKGYDTSSGEMIQRPNAVTVSTVHKMKGLEFPVVFVVDVENQRFPKKRQKYDKWIPERLVAASLANGAYQSTRPEEARLFYTALTRAERFLYVTGAREIPGAKRNYNPSPFTGHLVNDGRVQTDSSIASPVGPASSPAQRLEDVNLPTSYSDVKYYLKCPKDYQFRKLYGFSPSIPDLFGFGATVHATIGKLHQEYGERSPTVEEASVVANDMFHLKHVHASNDPESKPGPYELAKKKAASIVADYVNEFGDDFKRKRQLEARFEIPAKGCVVSGAIDLMIEENEAGEIVDACVVDFKTLEGGVDPAENSDLGWADLSLQVQLYARAANDVLGKAIENGFVHLLKDGQRVDVPVHLEALDAAMETIEWAVAGIIQQDFPMRPSADKCEVCDFRQICSKVPQSFDANTNWPEPLFVPGAQPTRKVVDALAE